MRVMECPNKCKSTHQDEMWGKNRRLFTDPKGKDEQPKCTVCIKKEQEKK